MSMQKKLLCDRVLASSFLLVTLGVISFSSPAQAGFKWVPPQADTPAETTTPAPAAPVDSWMPAPQVIESKTPAPVMGTLVPPKDIKPQDVKLQSSIKPSDSELVQGFANSVPLSVALRQVLPDQYGFSVSPDINMNLPVSWKGGAPWRVVVKDMLAPQGLMIKEQGELIHIVHSDKVESMSMALGAPAPIKPASEIETPVALSPVVPEAKGAALPPAYVLPDVPPAPSSTKAAAPILPPISMVPEKPKAEPLFVAPTPMSSAPAPAMGYLMPPAGGQPIVASAPTDVSVPAMTGSSIEMWAANKGTMLKEVLETWGRKANVEISWQAEYDYPLQASVSLTGSFEEAVRKLLEGFQEAQPQPIGYLYNNQAAGQTVLVVQVRGNNYTE
jgi:hypothetical protein